MGREARPPGVLAPALPSSEVLRAVSSSRLLAGRSSTASNGLQGARKHAATAVVATDAVPSASVERGAPWCWSSLEDKRPV